MRLCCATSHQTRHLHAFLHTHPQPPQARIADEARRKVEEEEEARAAKEEARTAAERERKKAAAKAKREELKRQGKLLTGG